MRASDKNKAIYECNQAIIKTMYYGEALFNGLSIVFYWYNKCHSYSKFIFTTIPELIMVFLLVRMARPVKRKEKNTIVLVDPGVDLSGQGVPSTLFDALVVSMLVKILVVFSNLFFILYALIPLSMAYQFVYKPYKAMTKRD